MSFEKNVPDSVAEEVASIVLGGNSTAKVGMQGETIISQATSRDEPEYADVSGCAPDAPGSGGLLQVAKTFNMLDPISPEGETYIETLKKLMRDVGGKVVRLPYSGAFNVSVGGYGYNLCLSENIRHRMSPSNQPEPFSNLIGDSIADADRTLPDVKTLVAALVNPEDYDCVKTMATYLIQFFRTVGISDTTMDELSDYSFRMITDHEAIRQFLKATTPKAVLPYYQYGVLIQMMKRSNRQQGYFRSDAQQDAWLNFAAITGYTSFMQIREGYGYQTTQAQFAPEINISMVASASMSVRTAPLLLSFAIQAFCNMHMWKAPFLNFNTNNPYNAGMLMFVDGKPMPATTEAAVHTFFANYCIDPVLIVDTQEGYINHPGIELVTSQNQNDYQTIVEQIAMLANSADVIDNLPALVKNVWYEHTGVVNTPNGLVDSREIDYFTAVQSTTEWGVLQRFLVHGAPKDRLEAVRALGYTECASLYNCRKSMLHSRACGTIMELMRSLDVQCQLPDASGSYSRVDPTAWCTTGAELRSAIGFGFTGSANRSGFRQQMSPSRFNRI